MGKNYFFKRFDQILRRQRTNQFRKNSRQSGFFISSCKRLKIRVIKNFRLILLRLTHQKRTIWILIKKMTSRGDFSKFLESTHNGTNVLCHMAQKYNNYTQDITSTHKPLQWVQACYHMQKESLGWHTLHGRRCLWHLSRSFLWASKNWSLTIFQ